MEPLAGLGGKVRAGIDVREADAAGRSGPAECGGLGKDGLGRLLGRRGQGPGQKQGQEEKQRVEGRVTHAPPVK
jgi:hypothetical protein